MDTSELPEDIEAVHIGGGFHEVSLTTLLRRQAGVLKAGEEGSGVRALLVSNEFFPRNFDVVKDFFKQAFPNVLALMHGNNSGAAVRMAKINMASFLANFLKSQWLKIARPSEPFPGS